MRDQYTHGQLAHHEREAIRAMESKMAIGDIDNDGLIYEDVRRFNNDEYMGERERIAEVIELHATTGEDLDYWYDRANIVEGMQRQMNERVNS